MKLRSQILIFLLLFALVPLAVTVVFNLPRVLELLSTFHRQIYLQDMRSDFRDLDQHLSSRQEMLKLLAKLPEPEIMLGHAGAGGEASIDMARAHYTEWINRFLPDQLDIIEIFFLDRQGRARFWLERNQATYKWLPTEKIPVLPASELIHNALAMKHPGVLVSKVRINAAAIKTDPRHIMNLHLVSPLGFVPGSGPGGVAVMTVDIGGMAQRYNDTYWAYDDGRYLEVSKEAQTGRNAFDDFPGLKSHFAKGKLTLWEGLDGRQVIWVPLIHTEASGPVWVGRSVDSSPLEDFRSQLIIRVVVIVLLLMAVTWMIARWFAQKVDVISYQLTDGISRLLEKDDDSVTFDWSWTEESRLLGDKLSRLAKKHASNSRSLRAHTRELEESNRYKSEFLANVSHELRTPLNSILLLSKMLADKESGLSAENARQASVIYQAGRDLQALIDDILDLSRIEARRMALNLENISLLKLLEELIDLMQPQFEQKGLYLKLDFDADAPVRINSDPDKIRQILKNFLSNAVKFTREGGVVIRVSHETGSENAGSLPVCISVRDTGIGIPEDKQNLVFQAFKQADGSTSRVYGGTGLGLTISRQLAELLGGEIELHSKTGQGADFRLRLPLVFDRERIVHEQLGVDEEASEEELLAEPAETTDSDSDDLCFHGKRVLVVEADVPHLLVLNTLLEKWGFEVLGAGDEEEALDVLSEDSVSLVLLDIMMPGSKGCDTIYRIREQFEAGVLPVIAMSTRATPEEREHCFNSGANDYLSKPVNENELRRIIMSVFEKEVAEK